MHDKKIIEMLQDESNVLLLKIVPGPRSIGFHFIFEKADKIDKARFTKEWAGEVSREAAICHLLVWRELNKYMKERKESAGDPLARDGFDAIEYEGGEENVYYGLPEIGEESEKVVRLTEEGVERTLKVMLEKWKPEFEFSSKVIDTREAAEIMLDMMRFNVYSQNPLTSVIPMQQRLTQLNPIFSSSTEEVASLLASTPESIAEVLKSMPAEVVKKLMIGLASGNPPEL